MKATKTNAMRFLDKAAVEYQAIYYDLGEREFSGEAVAELTGMPANQSFKTLTTKTDKQVVNIFVIPVDRELDLKKAAKAVQAKHVEMAHVKDLLGLTGYLRGEVSPLAMKKLYPTFIHESAGEFPCIVVSAGKKGASVLVGTADLANLVKAEFGDYVK